MASREELDKVTVKEIRESQEKSLEGDIETFAKLVKQRNKQAALDYANCNIVKRIDALIELDSIAGLPGLLKSLLNG